MGDNDGYNDSGGGTDGAQVIAGWVGVIVGRFLGGSIDTVPIRALAWPRLRLGSPHPRDLQDVTAPPGP